MSRIGLLAVRLAAGATGLTALLAGTVFALRGGGDATPVAPVVPLAAVALQPTAAEVAATPSATPAVVTPAGAETSIPAATESPASVPGDTATVGPARTASLPQPTPIPPTATAAASSDLPIYKDTQVLAMAASVVLPSGKTFEQCVALGPHGARWPVPVHLYYEGKGKWLVETHLSEVQAEFDEASATFRVKHFAPEANECR